MVVEKFADVTRNDMINPQFVPTILDDYNATDREVVIKHLLKKAREYNIVGSVKKAISQYHRGEIANVDDVVNILERDKNNKILDTVKNFQIILENDLYIRNICRYNEFSKKLMRFDCFGDYRLWSDGDDGELRGYIEENYNLYSVKKYNDSINSLKLNSYNPLKDIIENAKWDGVPRIDNFLKDVCKAEEDEDYLREVSRMIFYGGINRLYTPGCKFDLMPIFIGKQGCVDCDTEYFNGEKWVKISEYKEGDLVLQCDELGVASLVKPEAYIKQKSKKMYHTVTQKLDMCLSPEHNVYYVGSRHNMFRCIKMEQMKKLHERKTGFSGRFLIAFEYDGGGIDISDDELRDECTKICLNDDVLFPKKWFKCSPEQYRIILDIVEEHGFRAGSRRYYKTRQKEKADFVQFLYNSLGMGAQINMKNDYYVVSHHERYLAELCSRTKYTLKKTEIKTVKPKDGYEYCFTVPSHILVLRRNNRVFVTGNCYKSSMVRWLALSDEYSPNIYTIEGKEGMELLQGAWVCELAELLAMVRTKDVEGMKNFITKQVDSYRPSYGVHTIESRRTCIFIGTTNDYEFLTDKTGNRRYLPVRFGLERGELKDKEDYVRDYILNCWREALYLYENNKTYLDIPKDIYGIAEQIREEAMEDDPTASLLYNYLSEKKSGDMVCAIEIFTQCLNKLKNNYSRKDAKEITKLMNNYPEWKKIKDRYYAGKDYGQQRGWVKLNPDGSTPIGCDLK